MTDRETGKGFTMIELLLVVAILGLLISSSYGYYLGSQRSARDGRRRTDVETLRQTLELYRSDNTSIGYPAAQTGSTEAGVNALKNYLTPVYISAISFPKDPRYSAGWFYYYQRDPAGGGNSTYRVCTLLERPLGEDSAFAPADNPLCGQAGTICNYCMTQP